MLSPEDAQSICPSKTTKLWIQEDLNFRNTVKDQTYRFPGRKPCW